MTNVNQASEGSTGEKGNCFNSLNLFSCGSPDWIKSFNKGRSGFVVPNGSFSFLYPSIMFVFESYQIALPSDI